MDLEPIRKALWRVIRVLYPGYLTLGLWAIRDPATSSSVLSKRLEAADFASLTLVAFVVGSIVYTACRAVLFELVLNRFFRDSLWTNREHRLWKIVAVMVGPQNQVEVDALYQRFKDDMHAFRDFLDMRFGWINIQIQTAAVLASFILFAPGRVGWILSGSRHKAVWIAVVLLFLLYGLGTVRQCRTLWSIERKLLNADGATQLA